MRYDPRTAVVTASPDGLLWVAVFSKSVLPRPRSNPEAARLQRQGPLSARLGVDVGPKIMNLFLSPGGHASNWPISSSAGKGAG